MLAKFNLNYKAYWGQTVFLHIYDENENFEEYEMVCVNESEWKVEIKIQAEKKSISYRYCLKEENEICRNEFNGTRKFEIPSNIEKINFRDYWRKRLR